MTLDKELDSDDINPHELLPQQAHESHGERSSTTPKLSLTADTCPALRKVSLRMAARNLHQWNLPWSQLTDLTLGAFTNPFSDYVNILRDCGALEKLGVHVELTHRRFYLPSGRRGPGVVPIEAVLPRLHTPSLHADVQCDMRLESFVGCLRVPALRSFCYKNTFNRDVGDSHFSHHVIKWLSTLIKKSHCSIRSLALYLYEATIDDALTQRFFDLVPALNDLGLTGHLLTCEFLKRRKLPAALKEVFICNVCCSESNPKANFAEWAEEWASDKRCRGEEGRESKIRASLVTRTIDRIPRAKRQCVVHALRRSCRSFKRRV